MNLDFAVERLYEGGWLPAPGEDMERLPDGAREVFVLHDVEGYRHPEIAAMTGLAEGTLRAQLCRARRLLMEMLDR